MLVLAGAGLHPGLVTVEVEGLVRGADRVYVDTYTMPGSGWLLEWARRLNSNVVEASRDTLESGAHRVIREAARGLVVVLVPGDPLIATTHIALLEEASRLGVEWRVVPGVSGVVASKTLSGLQYYRFGRTVTVPGPWRGVRAFSVVVGVYGNLCVGLHTLVLLDLSEDGGQLSPASAARQLMDLEGELCREHGVDTLLPGLLVAVVERAGMPGARVTWARLGSLESLGEDWAAPSSMVVPGYIHPTEADALERLYGVDPRAVRSHNEALSTGRGSACRIYEEETFQHSAASRA